MNVSGKASWMESALIAASTTSGSSPPRLAGALLRTQPDGRLAELAGEGSEAAFEEIVRRYHSGLVAFAGRISSRDSADDVVQDSMVKAHNALLRGDRTPRVSWVITTQGGPMKSKALLLFGIAAVLVASLFALPATRFEP